MKINSVKILCNCGLEGRFTGSQVRNPPSFSDLTLVDVLFDSNNLLGKYSVAVVRVADKTGKFHSEWKISYFAVTSNLYAVITRQNNSYIQRSVLKLVRLSKGQIVDLAGEDFDDLPFRYKAWIAFKGWGWSVFFWAAIITTTVALSIR